MNYSRTKISSFEKNKSIIFLLVATIYLDGLRVSGAGAIDLYYYYVIFIIGILVCLLKRQTMAVGPPWFGRFLVGFFAVNLLTGLIMDTLGFLMLKQIFGIVFSAVAYWSIYILCDRDVKRVTRTYLTISYYQCVFGLLCEMLAIAQISYIGVLGSVRGIGGFPKIMGTTLEPYYLAQTLVPAVYICLNSFLRKIELPVKRHVAVVIILCFLFTGSSSGYLAILFMMIFIAYNQNLLSFKNLGVLLLPFLVLVGFFLFSFFSKNAVGFSERINDSFYALTSEDKANKKALNINGSSFALYSNFQVAVDNFKTNPLTGSGIGSHPIIYTAYIKKYFHISTLKRFGLDLNRQDANSMFIRLLSETGLVGLGFFLWFLFTNFPVMKNAKKLAPDIYLLYIFNQGIFIMFLIRLLRNGNYILNGFFFFFFTYWLIHKQLKSYLALAEEKAGKLKRTIKPAAIA